MTLGFGGSRSAVTHAVSSSARSGVTLARFDRTTAPPSSITDASHDVTTNAVTTFTGCPVTAPSTTSDTDTLQAQEAVVDPTVGPIVYPSPPLTLGRDDMASQPQRELPTSILLGIGAVVLVSVFSVILALSYRSDLLALKGTLQARCEARLLLDQRIVTAARGDQAFYDDLLVVADNALKMPGLTPVQVESVRKQRTIILAARDRKAEIVKQGVLGNCDSYR